MSGSLWRRFFGERALTDSERFDELEDKVLSLERQVKSLELEWESTYNKLRSLLARLNKRAERAEGEESEQPDQTARIARRNLRGF